MLHKLLSKMLYIHFETDSHFFPSIYIFGEISPFYNARKAEGHFDFTALGEQWVNIIEYIHVIVW